MYQRFFDLRLSWIQLLILQSAFALPKVETCFYQNGRRRPPWSLTDSKKRSFIQGWNWKLWSVDPIPAFSPPLRAFLKEQTVQGTARSPVSILQGKFELWDLDVSLQMTGQPPATPWHGLLATAVMPPLWPLPEKWLGGRGQVVFKFSIFSNES